MKHTIKLRFIFERELEIEAENGYEAMKKADIHLHDKVFDYLEEISSLKTDLKYSCISELELEEEHNPWFKIISKTHEL